MGLGGAMPLSAGTCTAANWESSLGVDGHERGSWACEKSIEVDDVQDDAFRRAPMRIS